PNVSVVDLKVMASRNTTAEEVNDAMRRAASGEMKGVLDIVSAPLVSIDFNHNPMSSSFCVDQTNVMDGNFVRVMSWYDNEWGFSTRMADPAVAMGKLISMPRFRTLNDLDVKGKRVLVRADLNVPMKDGKVTDTSRIDRQAPTIRELSDNGAKVIVLSHFERPKGKVVPSMSLKPIAAPLSKAVGKQVAFTDDCIGEKAEAAVAKIKDGDI